MKKVAYVAAFSWSPNGRKLLLTKGPGLECFVLDMATGRSTRLPIKLKDAEWLSDTRLIGFPAATISLPDRDVCVGIFDTQGRLIRRVPLDFRKLGGIEHRLRYHPDLYVDDDVRRYPVPNDSHRVLAESEHRMSDGYHFWCDIINLDSGKISPIGPWDFTAENRWGFSRDRQGFLASQHNWVGPDEHDWERLGPLVVLSLSGHRLSVVSGGLVDIEGAAWCDDNGHRQNGRKLTDRRL